MTLVTTFHSFIPGDVLIAELPKLHPAFQFLNRFASEEEFAAALMSFHDGWYSVGAE
jgi:hypothetical protein